MAHHNLFESCEHELPVRQPTNLISAQTICHKNTAFNLRSIKVEKLDIVTIGLPFAAFKILAGIALQGISGDANNPMGWILIVWGIIDFIINMVNLISLTAAGKKITTTCTMSFIFRSASEEVGAALDVMMSCTLVAIMVGGNLLKYLTPSQLNIWSLSVVLNVLGAGISRIKASIANLKKHDQNSTK